MAAYPGCSCQLGCLQVSSPLKLGLQVATGGCNSSECWALVFNVYMAGVLDGKQRIASPRGYSL